MKLNIIHLPHRADRRQLLEKELQDQGIVDFEIWDGIVDSQSSKRGIAKAHKRVVSHAKEQGLNEIMIAEDDIHFTDRGAMNFFLGNKPDDYDIYLGGVYYGELNEQNMVKDFSGLTLYIIKAHFFDTFLSLPEDCDIDRALGGLGKYVVCNPLVVTQHKGFSDNAREMVDYDHWLKGRDFFNSKKSY